MTEKVKKTEEEWRKELTPEQYHVLREKGTERPFTGEYEGVMTPGVYKCAACGQELFLSDTKFDCWMRLAELLPAARRRTTSMPTKTTPWACDASK